MKLTEHDQGIYKAAIAAEPDISSNILRLCHDDIYLAEFDQRIKTEDSLMEKLYGTSGFISADSIPDLIRYTFILPEETYSIDAAEIATRLGDSGYRIEKIKNFWLGQSGFYRGAHLQMLTEADIRFEVQLHTLQSYIEKRMTHEEYKSSTRRFERKQTGLTVHSKAIEKNPIRAEVFTIAA